MMGGTHFFVVRCSMLVLFLLGVSAIPFGITTNVTDADFAPLPDYDAGQSHLVRRAEDFYLRIMPLGASITKGQPAHSDDTAKNGYRKALRDQLRWLSWKVNMVGSVSDWGSMNDRDNEGHPGLRVGAVHDIAKRTVPKYKPNVILINLGTNDGMGGVEAQASAAMDRLIDDLFRDSPGCVVVLSTLLPNSRATDAIKRINRDYRSLVERRQRAGDHIVLAEMDDGFITIGEIWDGIHPVYQGFRKMAAVFHAGILVAQDRGWLKEPNSSPDANDGGASTTCQKQRASGAGDPRGSPQILYAGDATIRDDGGYQHGSTARGNIHARTSGGGDKNYYFAHIFTHGAARGEELDEIIRVGDSSLSAEMAINNGGGSFSAFVKIDVKFDCKARGIRWGDVVRLGRSSSLWSNLNIFARTTTASTTSSASLPMETCSSRSTRAVTLHASSISARSVEILSSHGCPEADP
jgi:lysophospholipase L1-like esterase